MFWDPLATLVAVSGRVKVNAHTFDENPQATPVDDMARAFSARSGWEYPMAKKQTMLALEELSPDSLFSKCSTNFDGPAVLKSIPSRAGDPTQPPVLSDVTRD